METEFPLSHPDGVSVASLPWGGQDTARCGGDRGWIVEASTGGSATATWSFGKVDYSSSRLSPGGWGVRCKQRVRTHIPGAAAVHEPCFITHQLLLS